MGLPFKSRGEATAASLSPGQIANLAAWYDVSSEAGTTSNLLRIDASNRVSLIADRSGNSPVNALCGNGQATNERATLTTGTAIGTDAVTLVADFRAQTQAASFACAAFLASSSTTHVVARSFSIRQDTGSLIVLLFGATTSDNNVWTYAGFLTAYTGQRVTVAVVRNLAGNPTIYINGVDVTSLGSFASAGTPPTWQGTITSTNTVIGGGLPNVSWSGPIYSTRVYSAALDAAGVLADYNGTVQASNIVNVNFALAGKLASSFTATSGQTVTINSSGDLGARICGERDLVQLTASKQPIYLPWSGTNYGWSPGATGAFFSTPDSASVSVTGDIDVRWYGRLNSVSSTQILVSKSQTIGQRSYQLYVDAGGFLTALASLDGTSVVSGNSTAHGVSAGTDTWFRFTRVSSTGLFSFFKSTDGTNWTAIGTAAASSGAIFDGTDSLLVGSSASFNMAGSTFRAQVLNGINGTVVADFDPSRYTSGTTFTASTGETWTLNGGATVVTNTSLYFDGSDDYMKAAAFSLSQPETVYFVGQQVSWAGGSDTVFDGGASGSLQLQQFGSTPNVLFGSGPRLTRTDFAVGARAIFSGVHNGASSSARINRASSTDGDAGSTSANGVTLAATGGASNPGNITANELAVYSGAHDTATRDRFALYAASKWRISGV